MTDHQIIMAGAWICTAICWGSRYVTGIMAMAMTVLAMYVSFH